MRTSFENGVTNEAIVLQWPVWTASWDFQSCEKQQACALLSVKSCCFGWKPSWKSHTILGHEALKNEMHVVKKAYKFTAFVILGDLSCPRYPYI